MTWPDGKQFAFTIFDDTDFATVANVGPVYAFLSDLGFRVTKSVWPTRGSREPICGGETCDNPEYLNWVLSLKGQGHEIGYHMATYHSSLRPETHAGLDRFAGLFGDSPKVMANHSGCLENIYWGDARLSGMNRTLYNLLTLNRFNGKYRGHVDNDSYFWGDLCRERVKYVRNFVFPDINTLNACPMMPYHDPQRPYVNHWFASTEGPDVASFVARISERNQDRLESEGGACIMYTHLAAGFYRDGALHPQFKRLMERLSKRNGLFVPAGTLLDYLLQQHGKHDITEAERARLERKWLRHKLLVGRS